ncbi:MAG: hypothetical protein V4727_02045 [Verrucomicrobiota bacterium]
MPPDTLLTGWEIVISTLIIGIPAYIALIHIYRLSGKQSFADMNTFDLIVVVSYILICGTMLLSETFVLADGITALALLLFVQFGVTWLSLRSTAKHESESSEAPLLSHNEAFVGQGKLGPHVNRDEAIKAMVTTAYFRNRTRALKRCNLAASQAKRYSAKQFKKRYSRGEIVRN